MEHSLYIKVECQAKYLASKRAIWGQRLGLAGILSNHTTHWGPTWGAESKTCQNHSSVLPRGREPGTQQCVKKKKKKRYFLGWKFSLVLYFGFVALGFPPWHERNVTNMRTWEMLYLTLLILQMTVQHPGEDSDWIKVPQRAGDLCVWGKKYQDLQMSNGTRIPIHYEKNDVPCFNISFSLILGFLEASRIWHAQEQTKIACKKLPYLNVTVIWLWYLSPHWLPGLIWLI